MTIAERFFLGLLGFTVTAIGAVFFYLMLHSYLRAAEQRDWPQVEGIILESELEEFQENDFSGLEFRPQILYGYEYLGQRKTGERLSLRGTPSYNKRNKVEAIVADFSAGKHVPIYIDPSEEDFAVLELDSKAAGYSIWFPGLFILGGIGIFVRACLGRSKSLHKESTR